MYISIKTVQYIVYVAEKLEILILALEILNEESSALGLK